MNASLNDMSADALDAELTRIHAAFKALKAEKALVVDAIAARAAKAEAAAVLDKLSPEARAALQAQLGA